MASVQAEERCKALDGKEGPTPGCSTAASSSAESPRCDREEAGSPYDTVPIEPGRHRKVPKVAAGKDKNKRRRAMVICRRYLLSGDAPGFLTEKAPVCAVAAGPGQRRIKGGGRGRRGRR